MISAGLARRTGNRLKIREWKSEKILGLRADALQFAAREV